MRCVGRGVAAVVVVAGDARRLVAIALVLARTIATLLRPMATLSVARLAVLRLSTARLTIACLAITGLSIRWLAVARLAIA